MEEFVGLVICNEDNTLRLEKRSFTYKPNFGNIIMIPESQQYPFFILIDSRRCGPIYYRKVESFNQFEKIVFKADFGRIEFRRSLYQEERNKINTVVSKFIGEDSANVVTSFFDHETTPAVNFEYDCAGNLLKI